MRNSLRPGQFSLRTFVLIAMLLGVLLGLGASLLREFFVWSPASSRPRQPVERKPQGGESSPTYFESSETPLD